MRGAAGATRPAVIAIAVGLVLLGSALVLLASPRHRAYYFGRESTPPPAAPGVGDDARPSTPFRLPTPSVFTRSAPLPPPPPRGPASRERRIPLPDADGRVRVAVADPAPWKLPAEGTPPGWELKEFAGRASVEVVRAETRLALRLRSEQTSFALYRDVVLDLKDYPYLAWSWKVTRLPAAGDVRERARDDQAAQLYVIFPRWPSPRTQSDVIGYVWDSRAPTDTRLVSTKAANVRIIVVESGKAQLDSWRRHERNVAADFMALFGRTPLRVGQVAVMIDTDDTRGEAEALIADIAFSRAASRGAEIPTSMLR